VVPDCNQPQIKRQGKSCQDVSVQLVNNCVHWSTTGGTQVTIGGTQVAMNTCDSIVSFDALLNELAQQPASDLVTDWIAVTWPCFEL
jgi:hypothetical protein